MLNLTILELIYFFLEYNNENELIKHLWMIYDRYDKSKWFKNDEYVPHNNNSLFLSQIAVIQEGSKQKSSHEVLFMQKQKLMKVSSTILTKDPKTYSNQEKETKVNMSHNFIAPPKHYLAFEHLFNYKEILKQEYLDFPLDEKE